MKSYSAPPTMALEQGKKYRATIETSAGTMEAELFPGDAPKTVNNFVFLAREGFFDGQVFHRIVEDFRVFSGDPEANGRGGPGYQIAGALVGLAIGAAGAVLAYGYGLGSLREPGPGRVVGHGDTLAWNS